MKSNDYVQSSDPLHPVDSVMKSVFLDEFTSIGIDIAKVSLAIRDRHFLKKKLFSLRYLIKGMLC